LDILCVTPFYKPAYVYGGPTRSVPVLCEALAALGNSVTVYTTDANGPANLQIDTTRPHLLNGVTVYYFRRHGASRYFYSPELEDACRRRIGSYDLMYVIGNWTYPLLAACRSARAWGAPFVIAPRTSFMIGTWKHGLVKKLVYHLLLERRLINSASALHYTSQLEATQSRWLRLTAPAFLVPNPVELGEFCSMPTRGAFRCAFGIPADAEVALYLGRLDRRKGIDLTLASFARCLRARPSAYLVLAGPDEDGYSRILAEAATAAGVASHVVLTGYLDPRTRLGALSDADVFILTSYSENFGMAVVEALAAGLPVIVSDQVGIADEIDADGAGLVVPLDQAVVADKLASLLASPEERKQFAKRGPTFVAKRYAPMAVAAAMEAQLRCLV